MVEWGYSVKSIPSEKEKSWNMGNLKRRLNFCVTLILFDIEWNCVEVYLHN